MASYLGGTFLGLTTLTNPNPATITSEYDKITLYEGTFDNIWITNRTETNTYLDDLIVENYITSWDSDTVFLSSFNSQNLNAGNIQNVTSPITEFIINKRNMDDSIYTTIGVITNNDSPEYSFIDYKVSVGDSYVYQILPKTNNEVAEPLISDKITSDYSGWYLIDEQNGKVYKFDLNLQTGSLSSEQDVTEYQTYNQYNVFSQGKRNYIKGNISAVIPEELTQTLLVQSPKFIKELQNIINNGNEKILKSAKGDIWRVMTSNFQRSLLNSNIEDQIDNISINFTECGAI